MKTKQTPKRANRSGWIMLSLVLILYGITLLTDSSVAYEAFAKSQNLLKVIAPILLLVFFLMALLNTFIKPKAIAKYLGKESGTKGWSFALLGGILSHGSSYVWYPMLSQLRELGARDGLIVAFFYARAIKLPWLPVMVSYFGITFTLVLTFYIVLGAWMQGLIAEKITVKKLK